MTICGIKTYAPFITVTSKCLLIVKHQIVPLTGHPRLNLPSNIRLGSFARECQISHLLGRVLKHVFEPTSDPKFHAEEGKQLEATLLTFVPMLIDEFVLYGMHCAAMAICSW